MHNIEVTNDFDDEPRFNSVFSRNSLARIKDGAYVINIDDKNSKRKHWVSLFINKNIAIYSDSLELNLYQKYQTKWKVNQLLTIYLEYKIMNLLFCVFYGITFIEYMLVVKILLDYTNLFSPNDHKRNDKIT